MTRLATLDIVPTLEMFERMNAKSAMSAYHWLFLAQPFDLPERLIAADPDFYLDWTMRSWLGAGAAASPQAMAAYRSAFRVPSVIHAACEDYRAGATIDCDIDRADREAGRRIACPLLALWGGRRSGGAAATDPLVTWRRWADQVEGGPIDCGHFLAEEAPEAVAEALARFFAATG